MAYRWLPPTQGDVEEVSLASVVGAWLALCALALVAMAIARSLGTLDRQLAVGTAGYAQALILAGWIGMRLFCSTQPAVLSHETWWLQLRRAVMYGLGAALVAYLVEHAVHGALGSDPMTFVAYPALTVSTVWIMLALARGSSRPESAGA